MFCKIISVLLLIHFNSQILADSSSSSNNNNVAATNCDASCPAKLDSANKLLTEALIGVATCQSRTRQSSADYQQRIEKLENTVRILQVNGRISSYFAANSSTPQQQAQPPSGLVQNAPVQPSPSSAGTIDLSSLAPEVQQRIGVLEKTVNILQAQLRGLGQTPDQYNSRSSSSSSSQPCQAPSAASDFPAGQSYQDRIKLLENSVRLLQAQLSFGTSASTQLSGLNNSSASSSSSSSNGNSSPYKSNNQNQPSDFPPIQPSAAQGGSSSNAVDSSDTTTTAATTTTLAPDVATTTTTAGSSTTTTAWSIATDPASSSAVTSADGSTTPAASTTTATASPNDLTFWSRISRTPIVKINMSPCEVRDVLFVQRVQKILAVCLSGEIYVLELAKLSSTVTLSSLQHVKLTVPPYINRGVAFVFNSIIDEPNDKLYFTVFPWSSGILTTSLSSVLLSQQGAVIMLSYFLRGTGDRNFGGLAIDSSPGAAIIDNSISAVVYCADELMNMTVGVWTVPTMGPPLSRLTTKGAFQPSRLAILPPLPGSEDRQRLLAVSDMTNNRVVFFTIGLAKIGPIGSIEGLNRPEGVAFNDQGHLIVVENGVGKVSAYSVNKTNGATTALWTGQTKCDVQTCAPWAAAVMTNAFTLADGSVIRTPLVIASTVTPSSALIIFK